MVKVKKLKLKPSARDTLREVAGRRSQVAGRLGQLCYFKFIRDICDGE